MVSSCQIRAARALLGWSAKDLSRKASLGWATIQRMEVDGGVAVSRTATIDAVKTALEHAGIEFIGDPLRSPGVRLRQTQ